MENGLKLNWIIPHDDDMDLSVFLSTACIVATVYSNASARVDLVVEWAKNSAANKSPMPVNTISLPMVGINIECLVFVSPVRIKRTTSQSLNKNE